MEEEITGSKSVKGIMRVPVENIPKIKITKETPITSTKKFQSHEDGNFDDEKIIKEANKNFTLLAAALDPLNLHDFYQVLLAKNIVDWEKQYLMNQQQKTELNKQMQNNSINNQQ